MGILTLFQLRNARPIIYSFPVVAVFVSVVRLGFPTETAGPRVRRGLLTTAYGGLAMRPRQTH